MKNIFCNKVIIIIYLVVVLSLGIFLTYAMDFELLSNDLKGNFVYIDEDAYGSLEFDSNSFELTPILDKTVSDKNEYVIRLNFLVGGSKLNDIDNIIYDISLSDLEVDCELLSPYLKWKLLKNGELLSEGSLDYQFDTIENGRLVLTPIQQDLKEYNEDKTTYDEYQFYMWMSDSCQEDDLINCKEIVDQSNLINKRIKGKISIELSVGEKKMLVRNASKSLNTGICIKEMENEY